MFILIDSAAFAYICPTYIITDQTGTVTEVGPAIKVVLPELSLGSNIQKLLRPTSIASDNWLTMLEAGASLKLTSLCGELHLNAQIFFKGDPIILLLGPDYSASQGARDKSRIISDHGPHSGPLAMIVKLNQIAMLESRRLAQQLDNAHKRSKSIHEHFATMSSIVAHDFNNFLSLISLNASRLIRKAQLSEADRSSVQKIISAAKKAGRLLSDFREISQPRKLGNVLIDIDHFLRRDELLLRSSLATHQILKIEHGANGAKFIGNNTALLNCFLNLTINARDAMPSGGVLRIFTRFELGGVDGHSEPECNQVKITFSDNGGGMPTDLLQECFKPFVSTKEHGSGLGLTSAQDYCNSQRGSISIRDNGQGTDVVLVFPATVASEVSWQSDQEHAPKVSPEFTILIVDDDAEFLSSIADVLKDRGYTVLPFRSTSEAETAFLTFWPDLVISDVVVLPSGGIDFAQRLRLFMPDLPVLLMSGFRTECGNFDFLAKPFQVSELLVKIEALLPR